MAEVSIIGLDIAKHVFHAHGADGNGRMYSANGLLGENYWTSLQPSRVVPSRWKRVAVLITGLASSLSLANRCG